MTLTRGTPPCTPHMEVPPGFPRVGLIWSTATAQQAFYNNVARRVQNGGPFEFSNSDITNRPLHSTIHYFGFQLQRLYDTLLKEPLLIIDANND